MLVPIASRELLKYGLDEHEGSSLRNLRKPLDLTRSPLGRLVRTELESRGVPTPMEIEDIEPRMPVDQMHSGRYAVEDPRSYMSDEMRRKLIWHNLRREADGYDQAPLVYSDQNTYRSGEPWHGQSNIDSYMNTRTTDPYLGDAEYNPPSFWDRVRGIPGNIKRRFGKNKANVLEGY